MKAGIYKITSPTGRVYIGQSKDVKSRIAGYLKRNNDKKQTRLSRSFKKHGTHSHRFEILLFCNESEMNIKERHYQDLFNCTGEFGLNCRLTRSDDKGGYMSIESRLKLSKSKTGKPPWNKGLKGKQVAWNKGKEWDEANKQRLRTSMTGKRHSDETKLKMSLAQKGKPKSKEHAINAGLAQRGKIVSSETREKQRISRINYYLKTKTQ